MKQDPERMEEVEKMIETIREDCRIFGHDSAVSDVLRTESTNDDYYFYYDDKLGYVLTFWERGYCNWGMNAVDPMGFRFLYQRHIVLHDFLDLSKSKAFLEKARPLMGGTREFQEAEDLLLERERKFAK